MHVDSWVFRWDAEQADVLCHEGHHIGRGFQFLQLFVLHLDPVELLGVLFEELESQLELPSLYLGDKDVDHVLEDELDELVDVGVRPVGETREQGLLDFLFDLLAVVLANFIC